MKNAYQLSALHAEAVPSDDDKEAIFFKILDTVRNGECISSTDSLDELSSLLVDSSYYVAHHFIMRKGKKETFNGSLLVSTKQSLLAFIAHAIQADDLRSLLVAPVFQDCPAYAVCIHEDILFACYMNRKDTAPESLAT